MFCLPVAAAAPVPAPAPTAAPIAAPLPPPAIPPISAPTPAPPPTAVMLRFLWPSVARVLTDVATGCRSPFDLERVEREAEHRVSFQAARRL